MNRVVQKNETPAHSYSLDYGNCTREGMGSGCRCRSEGKEGGRGTAVARDHRSEDRIDVDVDVDGLTVPPLPVGSLEVA